MSVVIKNVARYTGIDESLVRRSGKNEFQTRNVRHPYQQYTVSIQESEVRASRLKWH